MVSAQTTLKLLTPILSKSSQKETFACQLDQHDTDSLPQDHAQRIQSHIPQVLCHCIQKIQFMLFGIKSCRFRGKLTRAIAPQVARAITVRSRARLLNREDPHEHKDTHT